MAYDVSALAAYTKENQDSLVVASLFDAKTQEIIRSKGNVMSEVKSAEQINIMDTDANFQAGGTCGFNSSGTTTFTRRTLTVGKIKVNEALCPKTLQSTYLQLKMKAGSRPEEIIFEKEYTTRKANKIAQQLEIALWQGDTASGNPNLNKFDGFIKIIDNAGLATVSNARAGVGTITSGAASTTVTGAGTSFTTKVFANDKIYSNGVLIGTVASIQSDTSLTLTANAAAAVTGASFTIVPVSAQVNTTVLSTTGITESNVRAITKGIWKGIPSKLKGKEDVAIFCGWDVFESYVGALIEANLFAYTATNDVHNTGEIAMPGTEYKLVAVHGLDSTNRMYAMRYSNMYLGCDILGEEDRWEIFFAKEADEVRFVAEWKLGVQVAFPDEIVSFLLA